jgi:hypothetical protein
LKQVDDQGIETIRQSVLQEIDFATKDISQEAPPQAANYDWCALATRRLADPPR